MKLLILLFLSPVILAQRYGKNDDPNNEPFLPIYPVYPYSPKLIKRGTEREALPQLTPELYAPKVDAKDSYSTSYSSNYPRDPYYPNYNPYPKASSSSTYSPYYSSAPYSYTTTPYGVYNSYSTPYTSSYSPIPYSSTSYPSYYYQAPYYYPHYYSQPLFPPPPPTPAGVEDSGLKDSYSDVESNVKSKEKKTNSSEKSRDNELNAESSGNQFVDGANYISGHLRDLDGQPSTYKAASPYNQVEQVSDVQVKNLPIPLPKTTYRVISVAGQPVAPDYPLPAPYLKAQQLEQLMSQALVKLLEQNSQQQIMQYPIYETSQNALMKPHDGSHVDQNNYNKDSQPYGSVPNVLAKSGLAYIINPNLLGKLNAAQMNGQIAQAPTALTKTAKYSPLTRLNMEQSALYVPAEKTEKDHTSTQTNDYDNYENQSSQLSQNYDNPLSQTDIRQEPNYTSEQGHAMSYQNQNFVTVQTPQPYTYQYTNYNPSQTTSQQQSAQYKTNLEDVNFGTKQNNKG